MSETTSWQEKIDGWYQKPPDDVEMYGRHAASLQYNTIGGQSIIIVDPDGYYDSKPKKHKVIYDQYCPNRRMIFKNKLLDTWFLIHGTRVVDIVPDMRRIL